MAERPLFRQSALDRLSNPDQLDRLMRVTDPRGWITLAGAGLVILVVLVWSIVGTVPTTITGQGILLTSEGILEVDVLGNGVVTDLAVREGDRVRSGQVIARINQPALQQAIDQTRDRLELARALRDRQAQLTTRSETLELQSLDQAAEDLARQITASEERIAWLEKRLEAEQEALALGLVTSESVQNTTQLLEGARGQLVSQRISLRDTDVRRSQIAAETEMNIESHDANIRELERELARQQRQYDETSQVVSHYDGTVQEIRIDEGQVIAAGQSIVSLEKLDAPLQAVAFIPTEGKRIHPGMSVQISPVTVKREEFGYMLGEVTFVSGQPATPEGMMRVVGNEILVNQLAVRGAPFLVEVALRPDSETVSGYQWSSPLGPPVDVETGTLCQVHVIVQRQRPISLVIPTFRTMLGAT